MDGKEFTASNGGVVTVDVLGSVKVTLPQNTSGLWLSVHSTSALREFFRQERDTELGRWRWPENPEYVVYRLPENDDDDGRCVRVVDETDGSYYACAWERLRYGGDTIWRAARAYFAAHPEPKPWHNAKPGEVWVLTVGGEQIPCSVEATGPDFVPLAHEFWATLARGSERITAGRRIWPEPTDAPTG